MIDTTVLTLTPFEWLILVLAGDFSMVVWFRGSIFATPRAWAEGLAGIPVKLMPWRQWFIYWPLQKLGKLLSCPLCLPIHIAIWYAVAHYAIGPYGDRVLQILAASGVMVRLANDVWPVKKIQVPTETSS